MISLFIALPVLAAQQRHSEYLSPEEIAAIREAQDINERVPLYLEFAKIRLYGALKLAGVETPDKSEGASKKERKTEDSKTPPKESTPKKTIDQWIDEYNQIYQEMLHQLDQRLDEGLDARKALQAILKRSPDYQAQLKTIQAKLGDEAPDGLLQALANTFDAIEGAQKTLRELEEKFKSEPERLKVKHRDTRNTYLP
jgi:hypothetical protein